MTVVLDAANCIDAFHLLLKAPSYQRNKQKVFRMRALIGESSSFHLSILFMSDTCVNLTII